jgi:hypothetical protein
MALKDLRKKGAPSPDEEMDFDLEFGEEEMDEETDEEMPEEGSSPLMDFDDDELKAELESRGFTVSEAEMDEEEEETDEEEF